MLADESLPPYTVQLSEHAGQLVGRRTANTSERKASIGRPDPCSLLLVGRGLLVLAHTCQLDLARDLLLPKLGKGALSSEQLCRVREEWVSGSRRWADMSKDDDGPSKVPCSIILPSPRTIRVSQWTIVDSLRWRFGEGGGGGRSANGSRLAQRANRPRAYRCAMLIEVRPCCSWTSAAWISRSVDVSKADVASSLNRPNAADQLVSAKIQAG